MGAYATKPSTLDPRPPVGRLQGLEELGKQVTRVVGT